MEPDDIIADIAGQALDALEDFLLCFSFLCVCVILLLFFVAFNFIGGGKGGGSFWGGEELGLFFVVVVFLFCFLEHQLHADL